MKKFIIPLLTVVMVVSIIFAGCAPATPSETPPITPTPPETAEAPPPTALPKPGEWTVLTGLDNFMLAFTVSPDSTGIAEISCDFKEFECMGVQISGGEKIAREPMWPITGGQFTVDWVETMTYGPDWDVVIQGRFDETATHSSGTWEISSEGTICAEGTWEASAP